ncbi:primosomal protein N' [Thermodesulfatator indicus DSM 15286]|uniref:Replication restart protein PriA n=1 Tax=Thermodesulfatator indicus (strain DSM 15286 / JCM 11887 / CIR29812) TaxID=667014 RepID=F8AAB1_THEID|nr:primosomal protein N' [Thermodesulfatator indicus]AEH44247.1 primosomal protein N' [Thermodesulfatator indicus DSM 15286]
MDFSEAKKAYDIVFPYRLDPLTYISKEPVPLGTRVLVPLKNTFKIGLVWGESSYIPENVREIKKVIDKAPVLPEKLLSFFEWMSGYYLAPAGEIVKYALPASFFRLPKKKKLEPVDEVSCVLAKDTGYQAYLHFFKDFNERTQKIKTAVKEALKQGSVIFLVPDRELLSFYGKFLAEYKPHLYHGDLTPKKREKIWRTFLREPKQLVIGTRLALFLPASDLALIVVEEEENLAYKQEEGFRANFRDLALMRAKMAKTQVILASPTPSVKSFYFAKHGRYKLEAGIRLQPLIKIIDLKESKGLLSQKLINTIRQTLAKNKQVLLFMNRLGYAPHLLCEACGYLFSCPRCRVTLRFYKKENLLECPLCAFRLKGPPLCPECGSEAIKPLGVGTERLEEICKQFFKGARVVRLESHTNELADPEKIDILISTAKIKRFSPLPRLGCVGVVMADQLLVHPSYHAAEEAYQLLKRLAIMACGGEEKVMLVQTFRPSHHAILGLKEGYEYFFQKELEFRYLQKYPPFGRLVELILLGKDEHISQAIGQTEGLLEKHGLSFWGPLERHPRGKARVSYLIQTENLDFLRKKLVIIKTDLEKLFKNRLRIVVDMSPL